MGIRTWGSVALVTALCSLGAVLSAPAWAASGEDYPSWDEVEAARGNQTATESTITRIDTLLSALEADAARLGDAAVARTAEADAARAALSKATREADALSARADSAALRATRSTERAAQVAAALYRSGGTDLTATLLLAADDDLLYRLGSLDRIGGTVELALERAQIDRNQAAALHDRARAARTAREAASSVAEQAAATALAAAAAADSAVAAQQASLSLLYDQLAALKNTTANIEQRYRAGQQASNDPGDSGPPQGDNGEIAVPGGEVNDVAAARAYAFGQLAAAGLGDGEANCLLMLWNRESGWRTNAYNSWSGAYGIPQSLPGSKMAVMGADWRTNYVTQVNWGLAYIYSRYDTPCGAWAHSEDVGWY
ncbi:hypothetical protein BH09ACT5_BH09ACT5_05840 [soil metagenome]